MDILLSFVHRESLLIMLHEHVNPIYLEKIGFTEIGFTYHFTNLRHTTNKILCRNRVVLPTMDCYDFPFEVQGLLMVGLECTTEETRLFIK